ncbi:MAG TPA: PIN domain-containing protein [Chloroflexota bacterium]|nr:PIN domain-containing protein [Chloroflexota bacterium]
MLLLDVNVLVYAFREGAPDHTAYRERLQDAGANESARGNLIPDAYLAALAIESGSEFITTDRDYARFAGLRWRAPF